MKSIYLNGVYYVSKDVLVGAMVDLVMSNVFDKNSLYVSEEESTMLDLFEQFLQYIDETTDSKEGLCEAFSGRYVKERYHNLV